LYASNILCALKEKGLPLLTQSMVSQKLLEELQLIIREEYGQNLSDKEISDVGNLLVDTFHILLEPKKEDKS